MADVILEITVPEAWQAKVLDAFNTITDKHLIIRNASDSNGRDFRIAGKQPVENNKQFGERVLRELGKAVVDMVDKAEDEIRYKNEIDAVAPPASDVPGDILI